MPVETVTNSISKADPSKFSILEGSLKLEVPNGGIRRRDIYIDTETGERFFKIGKNPEKQKLAALILKGVVNVSDVVKVGDEYYSHIQNFSNVSPVKGDVESVVAETEISILLIKTICEDWDHRFSDDHGGYLDMVNVEHHNLILNRNAKKINFYDFDQAFNYLNNSYVGGSPKGFLEYMAQRSVLNLQGLVREFFDNSSSRKPALMNILAKKISILVELYKDDQFESFKKLVSKSGIQIDPASVENLFRHIQKVIDYLSMVVKIYTRRVR